MIKGSTFFLAVCLCLGCGEFAWVSSDEQSAPLSPGCTIETPRLEATSGLVVEFSGPVGGIPLNELFRLNVTVSNFDNPDQLSILVDATMPAHGHGMLTIVDITALATPGTFQVDQMNLHMPGEWELSALIMDGNNAVQVRSLVQCIEG